MNGLDRGRGRGRLSGEADPKGVKRGWRTGGLRLGREGSEMGFLTSTDDVM